MNKYSGFIPTMYRKNNKNFRLAKNYGKTKFIFSFSFLKKMMTCFQSISKKIIHIEHVLHTIPSITL